MKLGPYCIPYTKMNAKQSNDLNLRTKAIKIIEETGVNLQSSGFVNEFLSVTSKMPAKNKFHKSYFIKMKTFCIPNDAVKKMK